MNADRADWRMEELSGSRTGEAVFFATSIVSDHLGDSLWCRTLDTIIQV